MLLITRLPIVLASTILLTASALALPRPHPLPTGGHASSWSISNLGPAPREHGAESRVYGDRSAQAAELRTRESSEETGGESDAGKLESSPLERSGSETQQVVGYYLYPNQAYVTPAPPVAYYVTTTAYPTYIVY